MIKKRKKSNPFKRVRIKSTIINSIIKLNCLLVTISLQFIIVLFILTLYACVIQGIWSGMIAGIVLQTTILIIVTSIRNWKKEVGTFHIYCFLSILFNSALRKIQK